MNSPRRWFQYSLRSFLVLLTLVAVWLGIAANRAREQREAVKAIQALGGRIRYDWQPETGVIRYGRPDPAPHGPAWLRRLIGDDFFQEVEEVLLLPNWQATKPNVKSAVEWFKRLRGLKAVYVWDSVPIETRREMEAALPDCKVYAIFRPGILPPPAIER